MRKNQAAKEPEKPKANKIFEEFGKEDTIDQDGMIELFGKLKIEVDDPFVGYILFLCQCKQNGEISREQFNQLTTYCKAGTTAELIGRMPQLRKEFSAPEKFKQVYEWMFDLVKERVDSKTITFDMAEYVWSIYLKNHFAFYKEFMDYLKETKDKKGINKDTWRMVIEFEHTVGGDLSKYKETDFWPLIIDNLVLYIRSKK